MLKTEQKSISATGKSIDIFNKSVENLSSWRFLSVR
jgi:hypothetical protein